LKNNSIHIALSILLTIAIADFTWQGLLEEQYYIIIDADSEKKEKVEEEKERLSKLEYSLIDSQPAFSIRYLHQASVALQSHNIYHKGKQLAKLYLLFQQLKLHY